ncbi:uncharacterized protein LOC141640884 [Silene latifolia]|uniref:uncharacterized protein LOC141640884 n=1 Tax=Silene latifolia TaxID=37657 RepID=UPI003D776A11
MVSIGFWNVRGFNKKNKQGDVRRFLHINKVGLLGLAETKVKTINITNVQAGLGNNWKFINNNDLHASGRIWLLFDPSHFHMLFIMKDVQAIHVYVEHLQTGFSWICSLVYGCNKDSERASLWHSILHCKYIVHGPWLLMGDFNNVLHVGERIGSEVTLAEIRDFQHCVDNCGLYDLVTQGAYFTWNNKQEENKRFFSRIDRVLANGPSCIASFLPEGLFDHSPCIIRLWDELDRIHSCFKYFNMWGKDERFQSTVLDVWQQQIGSCKSFQVVKKLKILKFPLRQLNKEGFGDIINTAKVAQLLLRGYLEKASSGST